MNRVLRTLSLAAALLLLPAVAVPGTWSGPFPG